MSNEEANAGRKRVTIRDLAQLTGFSKTTVSFAFNDPGRISAATRDRILAVADELGYIPDPVARNLSLRRIGTIGLVIPQSIRIAFENPNLAELMRGIGRVCETHNHSLTIIPPMRGRIFQGVRNAAVDGLIALGLMPDMKVVEVIKHRHMPFVTIDGTPSEEITSVNIDDRAAAMTAMEHVLSLGHRRIAILRFDDQPNEDGMNYLGVGDARELGYADALGAHGLLVSDPQIDVVPCECSLEGGEVAARGLLERNKRPTAIVAMSDIMAIGAVSACRELGIRVPEDVSVVGFDDIPQAAHMWPALTTIRQPGYSKGLRAGELLFRMLQEGEWSVQHVQLPAELVIRRSTAVPAAYAHA